MENIFIWTGSRVKKEIDGIHGAELFHWKKSSRLFLDGMHLSVLQMTYRWIASLILFLRNNYMVNTKIIWVFFIFFSFKFSVLVILLNNFKKIRLAFGLDHYLVF